MKRYSPAPFETNTVYNGPTIRFSPDDRFLLYLQDAQDGREVWQLPYPPGSGAPQRILKDVPAYGGTSTLAFFPEGRMGLMNLQPAQGEPAHLWVMGLHSGSRRQLTGGTTSEAAASVSPDGKQILFRQSKTEYSLVSASLTDATVERVITSELAIGMPAWARNQDKFVYESDRGGSPAIWMRAEGWDRPLVTEEAFPQGTTNWFMTPALSYNGDRVIYVRIARDGKIANWISSVSGGPPVRLTNAANASEFGGSWSPDGGRFAFVSLRGGTASLMVVKTTGEAAPALLRDKIAGVCRSGRRTGGGSRSGTGEPPDGRSCLPMAKRSKATVRRRCPP